MLTLLRIFLIFLVSISFAADEPNGNKTNDVAFINIAFDLKDSANENGTGQLSGPKGDMMSFRRMARDAKAGLTINIDGDEYAKYSSKAEFLAMLKEKTKDFKNVVFNYSGHGIRIPRTAEAANKQGKATPADTALLFADSRTVSCLPKASYFNSRQFIDELKSCLADCDKQFPSDQKKCPANKPCNKTISTEEIVCRFTCDDKVRANMKLSGARNYDVVARFVSPTKDCFDKFGLTSEDITSVFADKKLLAHVDACFSGALAGEKHDNFLLSASSDLEQQSLDLTGGGKFTLMKELELKVNPCRIDSDQDGSISLEEYYSSAPNMSAKNSTGKDMTMTPVLFQNTKQNSGSIPLAAAYDRSGCKTIESFFKERPRAGASGAQGGKK